jgi:hypothetical protein
MNRVAALCGHSDPLQIREPAPPVFIVGMAYIVAGHWSFATDFTFFCHDKTPYIEKRSYWFLQKQVLYILWKEMASFF